MTPEAQLLVDASPDVPTSLNACPADYAWTDAPVAKRLRALTDADLEAARRRVLDHGGDVPREYGARVYRYAHLVVKEGLRRDGERARNGR
jgi:hypothetical protein